MTTMAATEVDLQISGVCTDWRMHLSRARLGSPHYHVMQSQTAFPGAFRCILGRWAVPLGHGRRAVGW